MYARILVPLDGSPRSAEAIAAALEIAQRFDSDIYLLVAFSLTGSLFCPKDEPLPVDYRKLKEHQRTHIDRYLEEQARPLHAASLNVIRLVEEGDPADAICAAASRERIELVVMTSHGQRGWSRWISGSVAESVLRRAPCPVLVLRSRTAASA